jgi:DNA-binding NarL/FixJ family response regulator
MPHTGHERPSLDAKTCRFVIIEDDRLMSELLQMGVQTRFAPAELHVFSTGREALAYCREHQPELVLTDLGLPDIDGIQVIQTLKETCPSTRVIVLTGRNSASLPARLLTLGVSGYLDKASPFATAVAALTRVLEGGFFFSAGGGPRAVARGTTSLEAGVKPSVLSARERDIARMVANGMISKEIAHQLQLSPRTVEKARSRILGKLNLTDVPGLVRWCVRHGIA